MKKNPNFDNQDYTAGYRAGWADSTNKSSDLDDGQPRIIVVLIILLLAGFIALMLLRSLALI